jgi:hypothetical protein
MAETAGLVVGVVALAGLFNTDQDKLLEQAITKVPGNTEGRATSSFQAVATLVFSWATTRVQCQGSVLGDAARAGEGRHRMVIGWYRVSD